MAGVGVIVTVGEMVGVKVIVGVSVTVGVSVIVGDGGKMLYATGSAYRLTEKASAPKKIDSMIRRQPRVIR